MSASADSSTAVAESTTPATPDPGLGPVHKTDVFDIETKDGYRATMTVRWHQRQTVLHGAIFETCAAILSSFSTAPAERKIYHATIAEVKVEFRSTAGFSWPPNEKIGLLTEGDGTGCREGQDPNATTSSDDGLSPNTPTMTLMWVDVGVKTPNNPDGESKADLAAFEITPMLPGKKCWERGAKNEHPALTCSSRYES